MAGCSGNSLLIFSIPKNTCLGKYSHTMALVKIRQGFLALVTVIIVHSVSLSASELRV